MTSNSGDGHGETVAKHYNQLKELGREKRSQSRIFYMRNFNNWIKSVCIADTIKRVKQQQKDEEIAACGQRGITVLDIGCGKGGDLLKWKQGRIDRLVCADIAATSLEQCETRYRDMLGKTRPPHKLFDAEFIAADCTKVDLKNRYKDSEMKFDIASCQFSFHYCFESFEQAETMVKNLCENLKPGGYFIGTMPDANELVRRLKASAEDLSFGNNVYRVTFGNKEEFPLFGCQYNFHLEGVVDCPEFLVYFPVLEKLVKKYGLTLLYKKNFGEYFKENYDNIAENKELVSRMKALEAYPPGNHVELASSEPHDYRHVEMFGQETVGTLSFMEWEADSNYIVFCFVKKKDG